METKRQVSPTRSYRRRTGPARIYTRIRGLYVERQNVERLIERIFFYDDSSSSLNQEKFVDRFSIDEDFRFKYFSLILSHAPPCEQQARLGEEFREIRGNCSRYTQSVILTQGDNVSRDRSKTLKNRGPLYFHSPLA